MWRLTIELRERNLSPIDQRLVMIEKAFAHVLLISKSAVMFSAGVQEMDEKREGI